MKYAKFYCIPSDQGMSNRALWFGKCKNEDEFYIFNNETKQHDKVTEQEWANYFAQRKETHNLS